MPSIPRGQENQPDNINWFTSVAGVKRDVYEIGFHIDYIGGGLPGTQVFPLSGWEDATVNGRFDTGSYYAYDNANARGWTPELTATVGQYRIYWRWKGQSGSAYQTDAEDFTVEYETEGGPSLDRPTYIDVDDVRAEGLLVADFPDARVETAILTWQAFLERACRQWFYPKDMTIYFDGDNTNVVHLDVPIISVEYLQINSSGANLDTSLYEVYYDKENPKIALNRSRVGYPISFADGIAFNKGYKNQLVKGEFGYVTDEREAPELIKRALLKLVIEKLTKPLYGDPPGDEPPLTIAGVVIEETTDGHSIKYDSGATVSSRRSGLSGITSDSEILDILRLFRSPFGIAASSYWKF